MDALYAAEATAWGGRDGRAASSDGRVDVRLVTPSELGGPGGDGTNPEQLFAVGYAGCFHSALKFISARRGVDVSESAVTARVGLKLEEKGLALVVELEAELPDVDEEVARDLLERAHRHCPYSKATRSNVEVTLSLHRD